MAAGCGGRSIDGVAATRGSSPVTETTTLNGHATHITSVTRGHEHYDGERSALGAAISLDRAAGGSNIADRIGEGEEGGRSAAPISTVVKVRYRNSSRLRSDVLPFKEQSTNHNQQKSHSPSSLRQAPGLKIPIRQPPTAIPLFFHQKNMKNFMENTKYVLYSLEGEYGQFFDILITS
ncbi:unnamed protein product [Lactuca saligna]|uniref:Uncharacterized protein n=1 Tax=Lactuca saligna TaxID=75948 RepID=A0AA36EME7_LACSI|nr:unnamed protein product [Lactuca saligna]